MTKLTVNEAFDAGAQATLSQSLVTTHEEPTAQRTALVGAPPPQSMPVSVPFWIESSLLGA